MPIQTDDLNSSWLIDWSETRQKVAAALNGNKGTGKLFEESITSLRDNHSVQDWAMVETHEAENAEGTSLTNRFMIRTD